MYGVIRTSGENVKILTLSGICTFVCSDFRRKRCLKSKQFCPNFRHFWSDQTCVLKRNFVWKPNSFWVSEIHTSSDFRHWLYSGCLRTGHPVWQTGHNCVRLSNFRNIWKPDVYVRFSDVCYLSIYLTSENRTLCPVFR